MLTLIRTSTTAHWQAEKRWCECADAPRCNSTTQTPPTIPAASASGYRRRLFARGLGRSGMRVPAVAQKIGRPACVRGVWEGAPAAVAENAIWDPRSSTAGSQYETRRGAIQRMAFPGRRGELDYLFYGSGLVMLRQSPHPLKKEGSATRHLGKKMTTCQGGHGTRARDPISG